MKQLILSKAPNTKTISKDYLLSLRDKYIGVEFNGERGALRTEKYNNQWLTNVVCTDDFCNGNGWSQYAKPSPAEAVEQLTKEGFSIFEFDSSEELFLWMAGKEDSLEMTLLTPQTLAYVGTSCYYGVEIDGSKGFFIAEAHHSPKYNLVAVRGMTHSNRYSGYCGMELKVAIKKVLDSGHKVFEFADSHSFFQWLAE